MHKAPATVKREENIPWQIQPQVQAGQTELGTFDGLQSKYFHHESLLSWDEQQQYVALRLMAEPDQEEGLPWYQQKIQHNVIWQIPGID